MLLPMAPNERWSLGFVSDELTDRRHLRILCVVEDCSRETGSSACESIFVLGMC